MIVHHGRCTFIHEVKSCSQEHEYYCADPECGQLFQVSDATFYQTATGVDCSQYWPYCCQNCAMSSPDLINDILEELD